MNDVSLLRFLPQELKMSALWCTWILTDKGKIPYNPTTGFHAKSNDPSTFVSYPVLLQYVHKYLKIDENGKQLGGIGLGIFRGFSAIDIDHCVDQDGNLNDMAQDIVNHCKSYTELSPSKTGIRIIFKTSDKIDKDNYYIQNHNNGLEIYISDNTNKFVTITGNKISGDTIEEINIEYILDKYMKKGVFNIEATLKKDKKLNDLWNSVAPGSGSNESEIDMALCCKLAYYLKNNPVEIEKYFKMSPFYASKDEAHKRKWNTADYVNRTIKGACTQVSTSVISSTKYDLNDTGNARRFINQFGENIRYNVDNNKWMIWNGIYWETDIKEQIKNYVEIMAEQMSYESLSETDLNARARILRNIDHIYSTGGKDALLKEARHITGIPVTNDDLDRNEYLLCTMNGTIDLKTGEIRDSEKEHMISQCTSTEIDINNEPTRFIKFLQEMFPKNPEVIHYLQKAFGYSMTNSAREQKMFILHGDGNNGKSLLLDVIKTVLGSYAVASKPQLLTEQKYGSQNSEEIARLKGKRFIPVEETKMGDKLDEQLIKSLTSGIGSQVARFLYGNSFEFAFKGKIWMATNYEPIITGTDKGIWRRISKIPVTVDFTGKEDKDLREKLLAESPQILGWLLKGLKMYLEEGLEEPEVVKKATECYREEMDLVAQWVKECCECNSQFLERANVLYDNYRAFCTRRDQRTNQTQFGRNLSKKFEKHTTSQGIVYLGVRLKVSSKDVVREVNYDNTKIDVNVI